MSKKVKRQLIHLWSKVGFIVNLSQMVEYNLAMVVLSIGLLLFQ